MIASHIQYGFLRQATSTREALNNASVHLQMHSCQACVCVSGNDASDQALMHLTKERVWALTWEGGLLLFLVTPQWSQVVNHCSLNDKVSVQFRH